MPSPRVRLPIWGSTLLLAFLAWFSLGVRYDLGAIERLAMAAAFLALLQAGARRGLQPFFLVALGGPTTFVALATGLGGAPNAEAPLALPSPVGPWPLFLAAAGLTLGALILHERSRSEGKFGAILLSLFALNWCLLAFNVRYFDDWVLENYLTVPFALAVYITHRWFRLSNVSYGLIYIYMMLHIVGSHYTYAEVPFGFWLQETLGIARNHYDRLVHFAFGLLLAYPIRELTVRVSNARGFWGLYMPVEFVLAFSAIYEILEWLVALVYGGDLGIAYLGTQGDEWDAIKDMALAGLGAVVAMIVVFLIRLAHDGRAFLRELADSLRVRAAEPLGEVALRKLQDGTRR